MLRFLLASSLVLHMWSASIAATFYDSLQSTTLNPSLGIATSEGFTIDPASSGALFSKTVGTGNGSAFLTTLFVVTGDFTATVKADRVNLGNAELGVGCYVYQSGYPPAQLTEHDPTRYASGWADTFFARSDDIYSNICNGSWMPYGTKRELAPSALLRLRRIGETLYGEYSTDNGLHFTLLNSLSSPSWSGPTIIAPFLVQEFGSTDSNQGVFQDLSITADGFSALPVPEPSTVALLGMGVIGLLGWVWRRRKIA